MATRMFAGATLVALLATASSFAVNPKDIYGNIMYDGRFTVLRSALTESGQAGLLKGKGKRTLFAPTDDAWKKLGDAQLKNLIADKDLLRKVVDAHIVADMDYTRAQLNTMNGQTINGFTLSTADGIKLGDAKLIEKEVKCENGFIQPIDTVLIPKS